jgi:ribosome-associated heat shock protein Hsp15
MKDRSAPSAHTHGRDAQGKDADRRSVRLDKWLWAARFYKTRGLAGEEIARGRVLVNDQAVKPARELRVGDRVSLRQGKCPLPRVVVVMGLSDVRGPAPVAQTLYAETPESQAAIAAWVEQRRLAPEPARSIEDGRPNKHARRDMADWQRWSASLDDD